MKTKKSNNKSNITSEQRVDNALDEIASAWADMYDCRYEVRQLMKIFPEIDMLAALRSQFPAKKKRTLILTECEI